MTMLSLAQRSVGVSSFSIRVPVSLPAKIGKQGQRQPAKRRADAPLGGRVVDRLP